MNANKKRKIIDAHVHLYDHQQNRHAFLEAPDDMFQALVGSYSSLPKTYTLHDYLANSPDLEVEGLLWTEFLSDDPAREIRWAQQVAETLPLPAALVGHVDFLAPDLESRLDIYSQCSNVAAVREHLGWDAANQLRRFSSGPICLPIPTGCRVSAS
jgi:predicted TIM-barrel fold metal-dependent hydrolase